nr:MAG TPA: hypothetical protein [Caudoviricetes sp.]
MRIETPNDRARNRCRNAALLLARQEEAEKAAKADVLSSPAAWEAAYERALTRRRQKMEADRVVINIPVQPAEAVKKEDFSSRMDTELARFFTGMSLGAVSAAVILWAILIAAGVV